MCEQRVRACCRHVCARYTGRNGARAAGPRAPCRQGNHLLSAALRGDSVTGGRCERAAPRVGTPPLPLSLISAYSRHSHLPELLRETSEPCHHHTVLMRTTPGHFPPATLPTPTAVCNQVTGQDGQRVPPPDCGTLCGTDEHTHTGALRAGTWPRRSMTTHKSCSPAGGCLSSRSKASQGVAPGEAKTQGLAVKCSQSS